MDHNHEGDWVALMPVVLTTGEKQVLETIERLGSYIAGSGPTLDPHDVAVLEEWEFLRCHRDRPGESLVYEIDQFGKLWLKRCAEQTGDYTLDDDLVALFNSLDKQVQRQFTAWAAMRLESEERVSALGGMRMFPRVEHYGHEYWLVPSELLDGVSTTEPPGGMLDGWPALAEIDPDLAAEIAAKDERTQYPPLRLLPGYSVIVEYMPDFDAWSIMTWMLFHDADDARGWLLEGCGPPRLPGIDDYIGDTVVLDKDMPIDPRTDRADPRRAQ